MKTSATATDPAAMAELELQRATAAPAPEADDFRRWVAAATDSAGRADWEVTIRLVDAAESQALNRDYRGRDAPTNVLSFAADLPAGVDLALLGDLVICAPVVIREAAEQAKPVAAHWAHMTVHGVLHLLGFDHVTSVEAECMEARERAIMARLGWPDPYA